MTRRRPAALIAAAALLAIGTTGLLGAQPAGAAQGPRNWTTFGHNATHAAVSPDTTIGATAAAALTLKWKSPSGGGQKGHAAVTSSPAVVFNRPLNKTLVYVTTGGPPAELDAFDAATGALIWSYELDTGTSSSPSVFGNTVYFGDQDHKLYAVNATTGRLQCSFTSPGRFDASPVVGVVDSTGPVVFIGDFGLSEQMNSGFEWAINGIGNVNTPCAVKWQFNAWANPGPSGDRTGSWSSPALGLDSTGRTLVVFGSSNPDDSVYALDATSGAEVWRFQTSFTSSDEDVGAPPTISAPGVNGMADGAVYVNGKDRIEYAIDLLTGAQIWSFEMGTDSGLLSNSISGTCLVGDKVVVSYAKYTYSLDAVTGQKEWRTPATAALTLASPSVSGAPGDQVIFSGDLDGTEYAYRMSDGSLVKSWSAGTNSAIISSAAIADGMVFFGAKNPGGVLALGST